MEELKSTLVRTFATCNDSSDSKTSPALRQSSVPAISERYGDRTQFLQIFAVTQQQRHVKAPERCVLGTAPTLLEVNEAYGEGTAEEWLTYQITEASEWVGAREKIESWIVKSLAHSFILDYGWLRVTDVELFLHRLKMGAYGRFYGAVDPQQMMHCMTSFLRDRNNIIAEAVAREEKERREHLFDGAVTWEEYHATHPEAVNPFDRLEQQHSKENKAELQGQQAHRLWTKGRCS